MYTYKARVFKVVDGDTIDVEVDLGFGVYHRTRLRLAGVDAPERFTPEGRMTTSFLKTWFETAGPTVTVVTEKDSREKYGRYLAEVYSDSGKSLIGELLERGLVKEYSK